MKIQKYMFLAVLMSLIMFAGTGIAAAQEGSELNNRSYCEKEAKEAGMMDEKDIQDYVEQCLKEVGGEEGSKEKAESSD